MGPVHCSRDLQISLFINFFIKNGSHGTIHIFKNYFTTVFSVFSKINCIQMDSQCQHKENNQTVPTHPDQCVEPDNHSESILELDLGSGKIKWFHQLGGYDVFFVCM